MRIIAGTKRGMKLFSPPPPPFCGAKRSSGGGRSRPAAATHVARRGSRPITDRVKQALFNILGHTYNLPDDKIVADLFCGVGSLGLEVLSRGAEFVTFVEQDPKVAEVLEKNIEKAGFVQESKVIRANAFKFGMKDKDFQFSNSDFRFASINRQSAIANRQLVYDLIFIDPPYANTKDVEQNSPLGKLLISISRQLNTEGIAVVRTERRTKLLEKYAQLEMIERRQWGTMAVTILRKK